MAFVDTATINWWTGFRGGPPSPERLATRTHFYDAQRALTKAMYDAGVNLIAGTDTPNLLLIPGFSLHDELDVLVNDVGLTPYEALRTATINASSALGASGEFGTIAVGASADLVLVNSNPLEALAPIRHPIGVMTRGHWLDRDALDQLLASLRSR